MVYRLPTDVYPAQCGTIRASRSVHPWRNDIRPGGCFGEPCLHFRQLLGRKNHSGEYVRSFVYQLDQRVISQDFWLPCPWTRTLTSVMTP